jgi:hypothetical protein
MEDNDLEFEGCLDRAHQLTYLLLTYLVLGTYLLLIYLVIVTEVIGINQFLSTYSTYSTVTSVLARVSTDLLFSKRNQFTTPIIALLPEVFCHLTITFLYLFFHSQL